MVTIPLGLWLCGAGPSASVDLNRYLSGTLTAECNRLIRENPKRVVEISSSQVNLSEFRERLRKLVEFLPRWRFAGVSRSDQTCNTYLRRMPGDCRFRNIYSMSIFLTPSFEPIPPAQVLAILREAKRVLMPEGILSAGV